MNTKPILVSLGYNCEVSFRLEDYYGKLDSYLFSWSFEDSRIGFIKALENMEDVLKGELKLCPDHMIQDQRYKIRFHPRYDILPQTGEITDEQFIKAVEELKSRIDHLKNKTLDLCKSEKEIIFIIKVASKSVKSNVKYLSNLRVALDKIQISNYQIVAVFERNAALKEILALEDSRLKIRTVRKFAPLKHTDIMGDIRGWYKIINEFSGEAQQNYYANIKMRRKHIIPLMIENKLKRIILALQG